MTNVVETEYMAPTRTTPPEVNPLKRLAATVCQTGECIMTALKCDICLQFKAHMYFIDV